jgi:hypothetical protein
MSNRRMTHPDAQIDNRLARGGSAWSRRRATGPMVVCVALATRDTGQIKPRATRESTAWVGCGPRLTTCRQAPIFRLHSSPFNSTGASRNGYGC